MKTELQNAIDALNSLIPLPDPNQVSYSISDLLRYRVEVIERFANAILKSAGVVVKS